MLSIKDASSDIFNKLISQRKELAEELSNINELIALASKEFKNAADKGDHSENAAYSEAKNKLTKLNSQKLQILRSISDLNSLNPDLKYVPKSYIDIYSTFRLKRLDTGEISTWRVFPGSISDIDIGVMSSECTIFKYLLDKEVGDIISTTHRISGNVVKFEVLEVY